jgi:hypothetical protein
METNDLPALELRLANLSERIAANDREFRREMETLGQHKSLTHHEQKKLREEASWREIRANQGFRAELRSALDDLTRLYLEAGSEEREYIRSMVRDKRAVLLELNNYIIRALEKFLSTRDENWLRQGLASIAIEDLRFDYRDTLYTLGSFYITLTEAGLEPRPFIEEAAAISSSQANTTGISTRDFLTNFESSDFYEGSVKPKLQKSEIRNQKSDT